MSCCGKKRQELIRDRREGERQPTPVTQVRDLSDGKETVVRLFEFIGSQSLTIRGISTGQVYHFNKPGVVLEVPLADSFAFMAERDLKFRKG